MQVEAGALQPSLGAGKAARTLGVRCQQRSLLSGYCTPKKKALPPWHGDSHAPWQICVPGAAICLSFLEKSAFQVYQREIVRASLATPSRVPVRAHFPGPWSVSHRHVPCAVEERSNFTPRYGLPELRTSSGTRTNL